MNSFVEKLPGGIDLEMVAIPDGSFMMGSNENGFFKKWETGGAVPRHQVRVNSFYIGRYSITQSQYGALINKNPSKFKRGNHHPVERVTWDEATKFCKLLSNMTGKNYKLPSEAQWEYACRAGTSTKYYFGDNPEDLEDHAWYKKNSAKSTHRVGQKMPNPWGLYDMYGNVGEYCEDDWHKNYEGAPNNDIAWLSGKQKGYFNDWVVMRGDSFDDLHLGGSAGRSFGDRSIRNAFFGFRIACIGT